MNPGRGGSSGVSAEWVDPSNADQKFGIPPSKVIDYLALIGDSADNVPGAPGVGPKTALKLLEEYGTVEQMIEHGAEMKGKRAREAFTDHADMVRLSKELVTIMRDLDIELDLEALKVREPDYPALHDIFTDLGFRRLADKYIRAGQEAGVEVEALESTTAEEAEYTLVTDAAGVKAAVDVIRAEGDGVIALHTIIENAGLLCGGGARPIGVALAIGGGRGWYLPLQHRTGGALELDLGDTEASGVPNLPGWGSETMAPLRALIEDPEVMVVSHDLKRELHLLQDAGVSIEGELRDVMIASYVLDPGRRSHDLDVLAMEVLVHRVTPLDEVTGKGRSRTPFAELDLPAACDWAAERADVARRLNDRFRAQLEEQGLAELYRTLELPLVPVLAEMERAGIKIDRTFFREMSERINGELEHVRSDIWKAAGEEFNLNSTLQLREVLFDKLQLPVLKKTKTGPSTDASVLEELATEGHEVPRRMLEYRELEKLRSTYVDALPKLVHPRSGRIHTSFNQTVAATGRLSSSEPNLQNIPIRTALGREVRKGFVAREGCLLLGVDYSQIELRVMAHFSGDEAFVTAFRSGTDVHRQTAAVIFDIPVDEVTPHQRGQAKTINFATLYGQGAFSLATQLGVPRGAAQEFIDQYFERFAGVRTFLDEQVDLARSQGYVETLLGRRRFIPELKSPNWNIRQFGERVAQNTPIQGTAADLIKQAMLDVQVALEEAGYAESGAACMLLQVHDELLFEVEEDQVEAVRALVVDRMEQAVELDVPVVADAGVGKSWYDAKG